ncbi:MAG: sigma-54-dependent Fis family transcriptional regulator [Pseudobdellovibrionaceae bacterium]|nr:sigma-54-dependent Fis family transcriptional regulator [Bdellovibrionales bacterium]USN48984.1 MAG: sigma-54-dependent Fis family transcriptional regulator [Pseudobdellovibrionaceae bacterium]
MALPEPWKMQGTSDFKNLPTEKFDAAFVDMHLTGNLERAEGVDVIQRLHDQDPHLEIIAMSGDLDRDLMERCLKAGASRFLAKPLNQDEVVLTLEKIEAWLLLQDATQSRQVPKMRWVGSSDPSKSTQRLIAALRGEPGPILIEGETGTGKEVVAHLLNQQDQRKPFITVNVAAIPENLFESEIFGHVRGAFTGADQNKMGLAEAAHGGDLFLDEIEALQPAMQAKLLRFLESGEVRRVGSRDAIHVDVRVISATNQNLDQLVKEDKFREDLLFRLSGAKIQLPPLRERSEDVTELCQFFFSKNKSRSKTLEPDAIAELKAYKWPGNVRELRRVCEQLLLLAPLPFIRKQDVLRVIHPSPEGNTSSAPVDLDRGLSGLMNDYEKQIILLALKKHSDIGDAAKILQISRSSLYKKIKDHEIDWKP